MSEWTETAQRALNEYCARSRAVLAGSGADADEVVDDLRRHIDEEVKHAGLKVVTEADIRRVLARFGEPREAAERKAPSEPPAPASTAKRDDKGPGILLLLLGVVLPLITFIFELVTGVSAGVLYDPMPGWLQIVAVALVPAVNFWTWRAARARDARHAGLLGWLNGAVIGICLFYALMYLPFTPFALAGIVYFGAGLIPLTPLIVLMVTPRLRIDYKRRISRARLPGWGIAAGFGFLALLQIPTALTYRGLTDAASDEPAARLSGIRLLRNFGDRDLMLRACYGLLRREIDFDLIRMVAGDRNIPSDQAREIYYRVTGTPFNSVPPPSLFTRQGRWTSQLEEEFTWDDGLGGESVAGRVKGLSLLGSRLDAVAEPDAALVYCEWTLEFKNVAGRAQEARAQIALPPGGVVSRLTLWINGEEREAAFGGRSQTRQAYQEVAVAQRRDPVLVTTCGPDRVLVQCFPVPANGGVMKVRLGITAPLILESLEQGRFLWPQLVERNFGLAPDFKHGLWIESAAQLSGVPGAAITPKTDTHPFTLRHSISAPGSLDPSPTVIVHRSAQAGAVWVPTEQNGRIIRQSIRPVSPVMPSRFVLVVDGSAGMERFAPEIIDALSEIPETADVAVVIAGDEVRVLNERLQKATPEVRNALGRGLGQVRFAGGQDNVPALEIAWDIASAVEGGVILWIHQPQSALLSPETGLRQAMERAVNRTRLLDIQTVSGADRITEKLDGLNSIRRVPRVESLRADLARLFGQWTGKNPRFELVREEAAASGDSGSQASKHLARLWARDETLRLMGLHDPEEATRVAAGNQLVTPLTGAVVLETQQQFERHGLKPADPKTVPAVPEPQVGTLVGVGWIAWAMWRFKKRSVKRET